MKTRLFILLVLFSAQIIFAEKTFYVSLAGNDNWSGALPEANIDGTDGPFATVQKARDAIRSLAKTENITVEIRGGTYFLDQTLLFEPKDSGTAAWPITYKNYGDESVTLSGGKPVTGWRQQGSLLVTTIDQVAAQEFYFKEFYVNDERRTRARNPNTGEFFRIRGSVEGNEHATFRFKPGDLDHYENFDDVNVVFYWLWLGIHLWIDDLDLAENVAEFSPNLWFATTEADNRSRYYVENAFEFLDAPGEWYLNRQTGALYYYPMPGETADNIEAIFPITDRVVQFQGDVNRGQYVSNIRLQGLAFKHADWIIPSKDKIEGQAHIQLDDAIIHIIGAQNCAISDCEVALGGAHGIILSKGSSGNTVEKCHIHALGGGGVYIGDTSGWNACNNPGANAEIVENTVDNCFIHDLTHVHHGSVGVWVGGASFSTISHNEICDTDYAGISVGWCWGYGAAMQEHNKIMYNHIHHLGQGELSDMGGIYTLGDSPGTELRENLIHDVYAYSYGGWGLYTDEGSSDILLEKNIVYNTKSNGFHQHYGQQNIVRNNIFAFPGEAGLARTRSEDGHSFTFEKNIVLTQNGILQSGNWGDNHYTCDNNIYWDINSGAHLDFQLKSFAEWQQQGHDQNSRVADPLFVDAKNYDFRLLPNSPAIDIGFEDIDVSNIGLYGDADWTNLPETVQHRPVYAGARTPNTPFFNKDEFYDDFEDTPVDAYPRYGLVYGNTGAGDQSVYVSNARAQSGAHSLMIDDRPLATNSYEPYFMYLPHWGEDGEVTVEFDMYMEAGALVTHEWRDTQAYPQNRGVSFDLKPGYAFREGETTLKIPAEEWFHIKIACKVGGLADGKYDVSLTVGETTATRRGSSLINKTWSDLYEAYFISNTNSEALVFIDNVHFKYNRATSEVKSSPDKKIVRDFELAQNYPNPFNPSTTISFYVADAKSEVSLDIYNANGRVVRRLFNGRQQTGQHTIAWDGCDNGGQRLASGLYFIQMKVSGREEVWSKKLMLLK